jgi:hypothetical protein
MSSQVNETGRVEKNGESKKEMKEIWNKQLSGKGNVGN